MSIVTYGSDWAVGSWGITIGPITCSGSDRALFVFQGNSSSDASSMTYAGGSDFYTGSGVLADDSSTNFCRYAMGMLLAPTTAANQDLVVNHSSYGDEYYVAYVQLDNVDQTTPHDTVATFSDPSTSTDSTPSHSPASDSGDLVLSFIFYNTDSSAGDITADGGQTEYEEINDIGSYGNGMFSTKTGAASSTTVGYSIDNTYYGCCMVSFAINPTGGGGATSLPPQRRPMRTLLTR